MKELEQISCQIIAAAGSAKSSYFEAIEAAKKGDFEGADTLMKEGAEVYVQGHEAHARLLQLSAQGKLEMPLLLVHAEDQMMNCETMRTLAEELVELYRCNCTLNDRICEFSERLGR